MVLYQNPIAMIDFMLDNLRCEAFEGTGSMFERLILKLYGNLLPTLRFSYTRQRETAFLSFILAGLGGNDRVNHSHLKRPVAEYNDALFSDYVSSHANTAVQVVAEGIHKINDDSIAIHPILILSLARKVIRFGNQEQNKRKSDEKE